MAFQGRDTLTPREQMQMEHEKEMLRWQIDHAENIKKLELEVQKVEAKWSSLLRLPIYILRLPVMLLLGVGFIVGSFRSKYEPGEDFWNLLRK